MPTRLSTAVHCLILPKPPAIMSAQTRPNGALSRRVHGRCRCRIKCYIKGMTLTDDDLKKLNLMMKKAVIDGTGEALEAMVFPKFESIDKDLSSLKKEVGLNTEAIGRLENAALA